MVCLPKLPSSLGDALRYSPAPAASYRSRGYDYAGLRCDLGALLRNRAGLSGGHTEISSFDESKIARYGDLGVRELWRLHARKGSDELRVDFLVLRAGTAPRELDASVVLAGLTPDDVCEAVEKVRSSRTLAERTEAVSRIVLRRQRAIVRVREEEESYSASTDQPESARATGV